MAQDLHDVLAHQIALITVQANAGLAMLYRQPDRTGESLQAIKQAGNSALAELRGVLDTLRAGSPEGSAEVAPPERAGRRAGPPTPLLSRAADTLALIDGARRSASPCPTTTAASAARCRSPSIPRPTGWCRRG
jgi:hypothetical protein